MTTFKDINFGLASAEDEKTRFPELLLNGFWDIDNVEKEVTTGYKFLFLGYKGSGKSSIGERLLLKSNHDFFVTLANLQDFPFASFRKIAGDSQAESRLPDAWSWLLLLKIIESLEKDLGSNLDERPELQRTITSLKSLGLLPNPTLNQLVIQSTKNSFKSQIPKILELGVENTLQGVDLKFSHLVSKLKELVTSIRSESKHLLIIDGLDDVLISDKEIQYQSLGSLIFEVARLNQLFVSNKTPVKIVVLCRTELFEKLPNANKNKIRQDSAVYLDWFSESKIPSESKLVKLSNLRASLSDPEITNVFKKFFPLKIQGHDIYDFLMNFTRHIPRDFLQLMIHIQKYSDPDQILNKEAIGNGVRDYSYNYFLPEIKDELSGYFKPDEIDGIFQLIGSMRKRDFKVEELRKSASSFPSLKDLPIDSMLKALFECSAIGNIQHRAKTTHYTFRFRNRHAGFNINEQVMLHRGLWKAMNLF